MIHIKEAFGYLSIIYLLGNLNGPYFLPYNSVNNHHGKINLMKIINDSIK